MKRKWLVCLLTLCCCTTISLCACNESKEEVKQSIGVSNEKEDTIMLNQRQKEILEQLNLPMEYTELTLSQKNAIVAIEDMLVYLDEKYDESFSYSGYFEASSTEEEHLVVESSVGTVTVYRHYENGEYSYEDNYNAIVAVPKYEEMVSEYVSQTFDTSKFKVFCEVEEINGDNDNILSCSTAGTYLFVDSSVGQQEFSDFVAQYCNWMQEQSEGNATVTQFYLVQEGMLSDIYTFNYKDKIFELTFERKCGCSIATDGEMVIF